MFVCSFFVLKQKTAYEMRISDWSLVGCSSVLPVGRPDVRDREPLFRELDQRTLRRPARTRVAASPAGGALGARAGRQPGRRARRGHGRDPRSEEHTSELQSLMRISYAVFCLKKKKTPT